MLRPSPYLPKSYSAENDAPKPAHQRRNDEQARRTRVHARAAKLFYLEAHAHEIVVQEDRADPEDGISQHERHSLFLSLVEGGLRTIAKSRHSLTNSAPKEEQLRIS